MRKLPKIIAAGPVARLIINRFWLTLCCFALTVLLVLCAATVSALQGKQPAAESQKAQTVIVDAGHGGLTNTIMAIFFETVQPHCFGAKS